MARSPLELGKRERQLAEVVYRLGEAAVSEVRAAIPDPPSYSAVRAILGTLVDKDVLKVRRDGKRYLYRPAAPREKVRVSALRKLLETFFRGEPTEAIAALLDISADELTPDDLQQMRRMIDAAARERRT